MGNAAEYVELVAQYENRREATASYRYVFALVLTGQSERARTEATRLRDEQLAIVTREPDDAAAWSRLAFAYAALGEKSAARDASDKSVAGVGTRRTPSPSTQWNRAMQHAQLLAWIDRKDEAMKVLAQAWWQPTILGLAQGFGRDALTSFMWTPLKGDPRFEALIKDPRNNSPLY